jgi:two-component system, OmpR family, alkaline phosphatase synthesis response regulator PhoP
MINAPILVVDDEPSITQLVSLYLEREGFKVIAASDGRSAMEKIYRHHPAMVILDIMLPEIDGLEVCKRLRNDNCLLPILFLTARDEDIDKILGLEFGADDYLTKPFNPHELVARVKAILRRMENTGTGPQNNLIVADVNIDIARRTVEAAGQKIELRMKEFELLCVLMKDPGIVFSREQLLQLAWGFDYYGQTRTVDVHIAQVRKKLRGSHITIETVTGMGYKLVG